MTRTLTVKRLPLVCFCLGFGIFVPILAGCGKAASSGPEQSAADFKNKPMPPEAMQGQAEAMKRMGTQANAKVVPQGTAPK